MQRLEVSGAVRLIYWSLGVKRLITCTAGHGGLSACNRTTETVIVVTRTEYWTKQSSFSVLDTVSLSVLIKTGHFESRNDSPVSGTLCTDI